MPEASGWRNLPRGQSIHVWGMPRRPPHPPYPDPYHQRGHTEGRSHADVPEPDFGDKWVAAGGFPRSKNPAVRSLCKHIVYAVRILANKHFDPSKFDPRYSPPLEGALFVLISETHPPNLFLLLRSYYNTFFSSPTVPSSRRPRPGHKRIPGFLPWLPGKFGR